MIKDKLKKLKKLWLLYCDDIELFFYRAFIILMIIFILTCMIIKTWVIMEYSNTPISEVPTWAWLWLDK